MQRNRSIWTCWIASGIVALGLMFCPAATTPSAQGGDEEAAAAAEAKGRPFDGYIATGISAGWHCSSSARQPVRRASRIAAAVRSP